MRKFLMLVVVVAAAAVLYSVLSDPEKRDHLMGTIESSTGVDLDSGADKALEDAGRVVGHAADKMFRDLGNTLSDPQLRRSLERWGKDALDKLDDADLQSLENDLKREASKSDQDFDSVFEKYLGEAIDS